MAASNTELLRGAFDAITRGDLEALKRFWTPETVERFPTETVVGTDAIAVYFGEMFAAVPDRRMEIQATAEEGDEVFVRWRLTGTHIGGPFQGIAATGRRVEVDGIDHFTIRDGKVVSNFVVFDQMQFARAVGLLPADGSRVDQGMKRAFNALARVRSRRGPGTSTRPRRQG